MAGALLVLAAALWCGAGQHQHGWTILRGGTSDEAANALELDSAGDILVGGSTTSTDLDSQTNTGSSDAMVMKFSAAGVWQWTVLRGGTGNDYIKGLQVNGAGEIVAAGDTYSTDLDSQTNAGNSDVLVMKFSAAGAWAWTVLRGGSHNEFVTALKVDASDNIVVAGYTTSSDLDSQTKEGGNDPMLMKFSSAGLWEWTIQRGGSDNDYFNGVQVDSAGNIVAGGYSSSTTIDSQTGNGNNDLLLMKVSSAGVWDWTVLHGGSSDDRGNAVAVDSADNIYLGGHSASSDIDGQASTGSWDLVVVKFNSDGVFQWTALHGGTSTDWANFLQVDSAGDILAGGNSESSTVDGQANSGGKDVLLVKFSSGGVRQWTLLHGASSDDEINAFKLDDSGNIIAGGSSDSTDLDQQANTGVTDVMLMKFEAPTTTTQTSTSTLTSTSTISTSSTLTRTETSTTSITFSTSSTSSTSISSTTSATTSTSQTTSTTTSSSSTSSSSTSSSSSSSISATTSTSSTATASATTSTTTSTSSSSSSSTITFTSTTTSTSSSTSKSTISTSSSTTKTSTSSSSSTTLTTLTTTVTTATTTRTPLPREGLTEAEYQVLEQERKEQAAAAVAKAEVAEDNAVEEALQILLNGTAPPQPGLLGQVSVQTEAGQVEVAAISMESLAAAQGPVEISGESTGASVQISLDLLREVAAQAGAAQDSMILLSMAHLSDDVAGRLATDNARAAPPDRRLASTLRSQPVSINFRDGAGRKLRIRNLATPIKMKLQSDNPTATCAFWNKTTAKWSSEGVETLPSEVPGVLRCSTTHLSIFGGIIEATLLNLKLALTCSTLGSLFSEAAFQKLGALEWIALPANLMLMGLVVVLLVAVLLAVRADKRSLQALPWNERQRLLMRVKTAEDLTGVASAAQGVSSEETEKDGETDEDKESDDDAEKTEEKKENKETAAGGDFEVPSVFRTIRGMVTSGLDTVSQAMGGDSLLDFLKEVCENAETSSINRAIDMLQARRSGADQATASILKTHSSVWEEGDDKVRSDHQVSLNVPAEPIRRDATSLPETGSAEESLVDERKPESRQQAGKEMEVQSIGAESENRSGGASVNEEGARGRSGGAPVEDGAAVAQGPRPSRFRASVVEMIGGAFAAARKGAEMIKARAMHEQVSQSGKGAATVFIRGNVLSRMWLLFPAAHTWLKVLQFSISVSFAQRVVLIGMKVLSAGALNALFFSTSASTPESDPECNPPSGTLAYWTQKVAVGIVSAMLGDALILVLFLFVKKNVHEKADWTEEQQTKLLRKWSRRIIFFWIFAATYQGFCVMYICLFLANVIEADAAKWLEATAMSLLQDAILKPLVLAAILAIISSVMLCRPSIRRKIEEKWIDGDESDASTKEDCGNRGRTFSDEEVQENSDTKEQERNQTRNETRNEADFSGVLPGMPN